MTRSNAAQSRGRIIKKYANRRLYDTFASKYVTISDLAGLIRDGRDFTVINDKSGEDITQAVLIQVLLDYESNGPALLPIAFLRCLINSYNNDWLRGLVTTYLDAMLTNLDTAQKMLSRNLGNLYPQAPMPVPAMQNWMAATLEQMRSWQDRTVFDFPPGFAPFQTATAGQTDAGGQTPAAGQADAGDPTPAAGQADAGDPTPAAGQTGASGQTPAAGQVDAGGPTPAAGQVDAGGPTPAAEKTDAPDPLTRMVTETAHIISEIERLNKRLEDFGGKFRNTGADTGNEAKNKAAAPHQTARSGPDRSAGHKQKPRTRRPTGNKGDNGRIAKNKNLTRPETDTSPPAGKA